MDPQGSSAIVTGAASGLGLAAARRLTERGAHVVIVDLASSAGAHAAQELQNATFVPADVTHEGDLQTAVAQAERHGPLRILVHCAGRLDPLRVLDGQGNPGSLEVFEQVVRVNLVGTFNVLRLAAASMADNEPIDGERGVCVLTASVAAFEGQIGQAPYASSKAGVVGLTIVAARDLASKLIRVCTIAPGTFDTPMLAKLPEDVRTALGEAVPHPRRLGRPEEFAQLVCSIIENPMLNGETIRLDGAIRMPPR